MLALVATSQVLLPQILFREFFFVKPQDAKTRMGSFDFRGSTCTDPYRGQKRFPKPWYLFHEVVHLLSITTTGDVGRNCPVSLVVVALVGHLALFHCSISCSFRLSKDPKQAPSHTASGRNISPFPMTTAKSTVPELPPLFLYPTAHLDHPPNPTSDIRRMTR